MVLFRHTMQRTEGNMAILVKKGIIVLVVIGLALWVSDLRSDTHERQDRDTDDEQRRR